jgi:hypothetical protein
VGDQKDVYKYWTSPVRTDGSGNFALNTAAVDVADRTESVVRPHVLYPTVQKINKIVVKMENTWASPNVFHIRTRAAITPNEKPYQNWVTVYTSPSIANDGTVTLWWNGTTWVATRPAVLSAGTNVAGIMERVNSLKAGRRRDGSVTTYRTRGSTVETPTTGFNSNFNLIAIEGRFEADLSDRLSDVSDDFDMADSSQLYPIGTITSNQGNIVLSNEDGIFNNENPTSPYYKRIEPNVEFNLEYIYTISGVQYSVQQFEMYGDIWGGQSDAEVSINLDDASKFLKETKPRAALYEGKSATEVIWRILDSVGFVDYEIDDDDRLVNHIIPFFWADGEKTVWELLDEIAEATQTAIYFNSYGKLQVQTRTAAFRDEAVSDWSILGETAGNNLADLKELTSDTEVEANNIDVSYKATKWRVNRLGEPALAKVWEPEEESVVLRSAPLIKSLQIGDAYMYTNATNAKVWPYSSTVMVDGELVKYDGKQFVYYTYTRNVDGNGILSYTTPVRNTLVVTSLDEQKKYDNMTPYEFRYKNHLTGALKIKERGVWNSTEAAHLVEANGYSSKVMNSSGVHNGARGLTFNPTRSTLTIDTPVSVKTTAHTFVAARGQVGDAYFKTYGTKMRFNSDAASKNQRAGIAFCLQGGSEEGYYVEFTLTSKVDRKKGNEITIYSKKNGKWHVVDKGNAVAIGRGIWYEFDVYYNPGTNDAISVWMNGKKVASGTTTGASKQPAGGRFGMYAKGKTKVEYEFIYALNRTGAEPKDDFGFYDLKYGGVRGGMWERETNWQTRTRWRKRKRKKSVKEKYRWGTHVFDEFGSYIHEVREFAVKFDPAPVQYSTLFSTNNWYAAPVEYNSSPFEARFIIANVGRANAILHGEDSLSFGGTSRAVNQVLTVLGRDLEIAEDEKVNKKNAEAIRARGQVDVELSSEWIQSKDMAEDIATWMAQHWSNGVDEISVDIFGNPLIEIGDIVDITYPHLNMTPATHRYFVIGTSNSFSSGIETTLKLRRIRTAPVSELT